MLKKHLPSHSFFRMEEILDAALLGDSDFDDEEMDEAILLHIFDNDPLGNRADLYGRFTFDSISNTEAKDMFRFEKAHIPRLAAALGIPENITTDDNITLTSDLNFLDFLIFCNNLYYRGGWFMHLFKKDGLSKPTC